MHYDLIASLLTAFLITFFAIPSIINIALEKNLFDEPGERASHKRRVPTLGGFAIFAGLIFSVAFWADLGTLQYFISALIIMFLIGAKDDIIPITPTKKFLGELLAALILVFRADVRLTSLYGVFGIYNIPYEVGVALTLFTIILLINAVNLIDGINGLSGSIGCIIGASFGTWFIMAGEKDLAIISFSLMGSLMAFLHYNLRTKAKIFMGDTGSLIVGTAAAVLAIRFIELNKFDHTTYFVASVPAVTIGVLIIPLFDTLRVFAMRLAKGRSPFSPDRNHIHHLLLDLGCSHLKATLILAAVNIFFIIIAILLRHIGTLWLAMTIFALALVLSSLLYWLTRRSNAITD